MNLPPQKPKLPFWRRCIRWFLYTIGLLLVLAIIVFLVLSSGGDAAVQKARAAADAQDLHWRWNDAVNKIPKVPEEDDAGRFFNPAIGLAFTLGPWPCLKFRDFNDVLAFKTNSLYDQFSVSCNYRLRPPELAALLKSMTAMKPSFGLAWLGIDCKSMQFQTKVNLKEGEVVEMVQPQGLIILGEAYRQHAVTLCLNNEPDSWKNLIYSLKINDHIIDPSLRTAIWREFGTKNSLIAAEYLLGQKAYTDAELAAYQKQLALRLENPTGFHAALFWHRAMADEWLHAFDRRDQEFMKSIVLPAFLIGPSVKHGLAEMITMLTEALSLGNPTSGEFEKWFDKYMQQYVKYEGMQALLYPKNFFLIYQLPRLKKTIYDYYHEQQEVRLGLLAIASERYRMQHGKFPQGVDDLKPFFAEREWALMSKGATRFQITFEPADFGLLLRQGYVGEGKPTETNWEKYTVNTSRSGFGFKLYRPELRGKIPPPKPEECQDEPRE